MGEAPFSELLRGAEAALGTPVEFLRVFTGGQHALTVEIASKGVPYVVRTFPSGDDAVLNETRVLGLLAPLGELAPRLVATGESAAQPLIVTTRAPGGPPGPDVQTERIARQMAAALARIHSIDATGLPPRNSAPKAGTTRIARLAHSAWKSVAEEEHVLTHNDFWNGNTVWNGDLLSAVVDWSGARRAPRGVDVAWCRQDLMLLGAPQTAQLFLDEYERLAGVEVSSIRAWDTLAAWSAEPRVETWESNYLGIGRHDITGKVLRERLTAWNDTL